jgi:peptidoglycan/LPS O-acetylase OafA/YrhL
LRHVQDLDWPRSRWLAAGAALAAVFVALAAGFSLTGLHWAWWLGMAPSGVAMGWAFGRAAALHDPTARAEPSGPTAAGREGGAPAAETSLKP